MKRAILLSPNDNVATLLEKAEPGEEIEIRGSGGSKNLVVGEAIPSGHKVAIEDIPAGAFVIKYNNKIGIATEKILTGQYVHVQNVKSARTETK